MAGVLYFLPCKANKFCNSNRRHHHIESIFYLIVKSVWISLYCKENDFDKLIYNITIGIS